MKTKLSIVIIVFLAFLSLGCKQKEEEKIVVEVIEAPIDLINDEFPEAQKEIIETFGAITQSLKDGDMNKLISFHTYGPKFTEFKKGEPRNDGTANEAFEREVFGSVTEVVKFDAKDLKIAVYGDVANVTFHSDFHLKFGEDLVIVNDQITLLFVKVGNDWKIVHEHHSPLKQ